jgi:hypothetical protein
LTVDEARGTSKQPGGPIAASPRRLGLGRAPLGNAGTRDPSARWRELSRRQCAVSLQHFNRLEAVTALVHCFDEAMELDKLHQGCMLPKSSRNGQEHRSAKRATQEALYNHFGIGASTIIGATWDLVDERASNRPRTASVPVGTPL